MLWGIRITERIEEIAPFIVGLIILMIILALFAFIPGEVEEALKGDGSLSILVDSGAGQGLVNVTIDGDLYFNGSVRPNTYFVIHTVLPAGLRHITVYHANIPRFWNNISLSGGDVIFINFTLAAHY